MRLRLDYDYDYEYTYWALSIYRIKLYLMWLLQSEFTPQGLLWLLWLIIIIQSTITKAGVGVVQFMRLWVTDVMTQPEPMILVSKPKQLQLQLLCSHSSAPFAVSISWIFVERSHIVRKFHDHVCGRRLCCRHLDLRAQAWKRWQAIWIRVRPWGVQSFRVSVIKCNYSRTRRFMVCCLIWKRSHDSYDSRAFLSQADLRTTGTDAVSDSTSISLGGDTFSGWQRWWQRWWQRFFCDIDFWSNPVRAG